MRITDSVIVSFNFDTEADTNTAILLVGRKKPNKAADIIHAIEGKEAIDLYKRITNNHKE